MSIKYTRCKIKKSETKKFRISKMEELMSDESNFLLQRFVDALSDVVYISRVREYKKCA